MLIFIHNGRYDIEGKVTYKKPKGEFIRLALGSFGCFGYPNGNVLVALYNTEEGKQVTRILGRFRHVIPEKNYIISGTTKVCALFDFESEYSKGTIRNLIIKHNEKERC